MSNKIEHFFRKKEPSLGHYSQEAVSIKRIKKTEPFIVLTIQIPGIHCILCSLSTSDFSTSFQFHLTYYLSQLFCERPGMDFSLLYPSLMSKMNIDFFERFMIFLHTFLISVFQKQFATNCFWITLYISILYFWDNNYFYMCYVLCCFSLTYLLSYVQALCLVLLHTDVNGGSLCAESKT